MATSKNQNIVKKYRERRRKKRRPAREEEDSKRKRNWREILEQREKICKDGETTSSIWHQGTLGGYTRLEQN